MTDFTRINEPRVAKIKAMLETIHKSARSNRVSDEDVADLLDPLREHLPLNGATPTPTPDAPEADAQILPILESPHHHRIGAFVAQLPADHLGRYLTHIAARLIERAEATP